MAISQSIIQSIIESVTRTIVIGEFHPNLCAYLPLQSNLRDYISDAYMDLVRNGELTYLGKTGVYQTAPADHPAIGKYGLFHDGAGTNLIEYSEDFSQWWDLLDISFGDKIDSPISGTQAQGIILNTNDADHTLRSDYGSQFSCSEGDIFTYSIILKSEKYSKFRVFTNLYDIDNTYIGNNDGKLDIDIDNGTVNIQQVNCISYTLKSLNNGFKKLTSTFQIKDTTPDAAHFVIYLNILDGNWNKSFAGDGTSIAYYITGVQLEQKPYASSYISTSGSSASRATQAADSSGNGLSVALDKLDPRVIDALSKGTIIQTWYPLVDYDAIPAGTYGLIGFNDEAGSGIFIDGSGNVSVSDGTNTVSNAVQWSNGDKVDIASTFGDGTLTLHTRVNDGAWTTNTGSFDGQIPYNDTLRPGFDLEVPCSFGPLKQYDKILSLDEIAREVGK